MAVHIHAVLGLKFLVDLFTIGQVRVKLYHRSHAVGNASQVGDERGVRKAVGFGYDHLGAVILLFQSLDKQRSIANVGITQDCVGIGLL